MHEKGSDGLHRPSRPTLLWAISLAILSGVLIVLLLLWHSLAWAGAATLPAAGITFALVALLLILVVATGQLLGYYLITRTHAHDSHVLLSHLVELRGELGRLSECQRTIQAAVEGGQDAWDDGYRVGATDALAAQEGSAEAARPRILPMARRSSTGNGRGD
jgi:hypothetical protein